MTSGVTIRPVAASDHAGWLPLWRGYCEFYEATVPDDITELTWLRLLDPAIALHGWVAELDGKLIGFTHALEHASTWSATPYVYLEDLFVDQNVRKSGCGTALIDAVAEHAASIGAPKVYWQTAFDNVRARSLYDKVARASGFMVYERPVKS